MVNSLHTHPYQKLYKMKKIIFTGGNGRFAKIFKNIKTNFRIIYPSKQQLDILNINKIRRLLKKEKPYYLIHCAALSRPMNIHHQDIKKSIDLNIIGTCNVVKACEELNIKLIYFSTNYVYPGLKGNYKETDSLLPFNNYGWSKLGGECAVQMYKNSLILRICMTEKPFIHKKAFYDLKTNFMFHEELANILLKFINKKGTINVGGKIKSVYEFAKINKNNISKMSARKIFGKKYPLHQSMNIDKMLGILKKK